MHAEPLDHILKKMVSDLKIGNQLKHSMIFNHWKEIVGSQISEKSKPKSLREGVLYVSVANSTWANELDLMSGQLMDTINSYLGTELVKRMRFKADLGP